jgi:hypothetical protein
MQESKVIHNNITIEFNYINIERKRWNSLVGLWWWWRRRYGR